MPSINAMRQIDPEDKPQPLGRPERLQPVENNPALPRPVPGKPHLLEGVDGKLQTNVPRPPALWCDAKMFFKDMPEAEKLAFTAIMPGLPGVLWISGSGK